MCEDLVDGKYHKGKLKKENPKIVVHEVEMSSSSVNNISVGVTMNGQTPIYTKHKIYSLIHN